MTNNPIKQWKLSPNKI